MDDVLTFHVDKIKTSYTFVQRHRDLIATKIFENLLEMWVFGKSAFVQLVLNPAECSGQLLTRIKPVEVYEWVFCFWDRVKDLKRKGHHTFITNEVPVRCLKYEVWSCESQKEGENRVENGFFASR